MRVWLPPNASRAPYGQSRVNMAYMLRMNQPLSSIVPAVEASRGGC